MDLNTWGYPNDVGLISKCDQMFGSFTKVMIDTQVIYDAVSEAIDPLNVRLDEIDEHIDTAKEEILSNCGDCGCCCAATKCDICNAVSEINSHIDEKLDSLDFGGRFYDLTQQINELKQEIINS